MKYIVISLLFISCNAFEVVTGVKSNVDPGFVNNNLKNGLIGYWAFNESSILEDKVSRVHQHLLSVDHTTSSKNPPSTPSVRGQGLNCTGATTLNSNGALISNFNPSFGSQISISFWVQFDSLAVSANSTLFEFRDAGSSRDFSFSKSDSTAALPDTINSTWFSPLSINPTSSWTHIAFRYDLVNNYIEVYQDGQLVSSNTTSAISNLSSEPFTLCSTRVPTSVANDYFAGKVDSFGIWDRFLSVEEIKSLALNYTELD